MNTLFVIECIFCKIDCAYCSKIMLNDNEEEEEQKIIKKKEKKKTTNEEIHKFLLGRIRYECQSKHNEVDK